VPDRSSLRKEIKDADLRACGMAVLCRATVLAQNESAHLNDGAFHS
jgi:hypothetical protein